MNGPLVSIIIPTRNSSQFLNECLSSIKKQAYKNIEIIVVDNDSTDNTKDLSKKYTHKIYNYGPERSAQRNYGAKQAKGDFLLFVDSDMQLSPNVIEDCVTKIKTDNHVLALVIPEKSVGKGFWAQCKALERSFYIGVNWIEAARFFDRKPFFELNGYDQQNTGTEDYDLPQRLRVEFGENAIGRIEKFIIHNEGELSLWKTLSKKRYYGKNLNRYVKTNSSYFSKQSNIIERYKLFFSNPRKLFLNPIVGLGMIFMKTMEFIVGGTAYLFHK